MFVVVGEDFVGDYVGFYGIGWWMVMSFVLLGKVVLIWMLGIIFGMLFIMLLCVSSVVL